MRLDHLLSKDKTEREFMNLRSVIWLRFALSSFEGNIHIIWGRSSAGRAPALQAGGQEFDSPRLHHLFLSGVNPIQVVLSKSRVLRIARNEENTRESYLKVRRPQCLTM